MITITIMIIVLTILIIIKIMKMKIRSGSKTDEQNIESKRSSCKKLSVRLRSSLPAAQVMVSAI